MMPLKQVIQKVLTKAVSRAFPVKEECEVNFSESGCDYTSRIPKVIFDKYKTGLHAFGLFNEREIADCIFVNCEKTEIIKAVQVSGSGDLQIFISDKYIKDSINTILTKGQVLLENLPEVTPKLLCHTLINESELQTLACKRVEFLFSSLSKIHSHFGSSAKTLRFIFEQTGSEEKILKLNDSSFKVSLSRTSNVSEWVSKFILLLKDDYPDHSVQLFYKYFHHDLIVSKSLVKNLSPYGEVFCDFQSFSSNELRSLNSDLLSQIFAYVMLKQSRTSTILIKQSDFLSQTKDSIHVNLNILSHLSEISTSHELISEVSPDLRMILLHTVLLPETLLSCIAKSSTHELLAWLERFSSLYITTSAKLDGSNLSVLNRLSRVVLQDVLNLVFS